MLSRPVRRTAAVLGCAALVAGGIGAGTSSAASDTGAGTASGAGAGTASRLASPGCRPAATVTAAAVAAHPFRCADTSVLVRDGLAAARLPARGTAVAVDVLTAAGSVELVVERDTADRILVRRGPAAAAAASSACSSAAYRLTGWHVGGSYAWSYNPRGVPAGIGGRAAGALVAATGNITSGRNDCGLRTKPRVGARFLGTTSTAPGVSAQPACTGDDRRSVTGWRAMSGGGYLAVTCTYYARSSRVVSSSDAAVNTRVSWSLSPGACRSAYDLQGALTHERGHTFGLAHVTASAGLTMYPYLGRCDFSKRTLGRGDLRGLIALYGAR